MATPDAPDMSSFLDVRCIIQLCHDTNKVLPHRGGGRVAELHYYGYRKKLFSTVRHPREKKLVNRTSKIREMKVRYYEDHESNTELKQQYEFERTELMHY